MRSLVLILLLLSGALSSPYLKSGQAIITGRVVDAETREPIPCTVAIRTSDGTLITDHPSFRDGFRSSGEFEKAVPAGEVTITISRGFDYIAQERRLNLGERERVSLAFELKRRTRLRSEGWYTGDNHAHMAHGERRIAIDFPYVALAARAEGLDYLSVAQWWDLPNATPDDLDAACRAVSAKDFRLYWNMEIPKNYWRGDVSKCLGHGWTLGMRGYTARGTSAITELTEMSAWDYESEKPPIPNFESQELIHALGGIVSYSHPCRWEWGKWGGRGIYPVEERKLISNMAQELPFDTVAGPTYDTLDILMQPFERTANRQAQQLWFMLLNHGYRMAATASSDTTFDNPGRGLPGKVRVYTRVEGEPSPGRIAEAMKAGRNFITSGPLLELEIGAHRVGDIVRLGKPVKLAAKLRAWASGAAVGEHLTRVEVLRNGEVVRSYEIGDRRTEFAAEFEVSESGTAWYIARCYGSSADQAAFTNPIYFEGADYRAPQPAAAGVTASVIDEATGRPLEGVIEVVRMVGQTPTIVSEHGFRNGRLTIEVPATARLRVRVPGYAPLMKSIFMDYAPLLDLTLDMRVEQLLDWRTFEQTRRLLGGVQLEFRLKRQ